MIRIFGRLFWNIIVSHLPAPKDAEPPILIICVDDGRDE